jgi:hypothetical protein
MRRKKKFLLLLLLILFIASGLFRDFVFVNVDEQTRIAYYHDTDSHLAASMKFLESFSYMTLYYFKWVLTLLFSFLFLTLSLGVIGLFFTKRVYVYWTIYAYAALFVLAGLFWGGGYLIHQWEKGYIIARFLMGMAQGPIVLMVLLPAFRLAGTLQSGDDPIR